MTTRITDDLIPLELFKPLRKTFTIDELDDPAVLAQAAEVVKLEARAAGQKEADALMAARCVSGDWRAAGARIERQDASLIDSLAPGCNRGPCDRGMMASRR